MKKPITAITSGVGTILLAGALFTGTVPAHAEEPGETILDISEHYVDPGIDPSAPVFVVDENGTEYPATVNDDQTVTFTPDDQSAACAWYNMVVPWGGRWYTSVDGCSLIGVNDNATHLYEWVVDPNSNGTVCMQGRGYYKIGVSWEPNWTDIGCGTVGGSYVTIGKVYTVAKVQGSSIGTTGTVLKWR